MSDEKSHACSFATNCEPLIEALVEKIKSLPTAACNPDTCRGSYGFDLEEAS